MNLGDFSYCCRVLYFLRCYKYPQNVNNQPSEREVFFIPLSKNNLYLWSNFVSKDI